MSQRKLPQISISSPTKEGGWGKLGVGGVNGGRCQSLTPLPQSLPLNNRPISNHEGKANVACDKLEARGWSKQGV